MSIEPLLTREQTAKSLPVCSPAKRVKHFVDQMQIPARRALMIPTPALRVDTEFFEAIMKDVEAGRVLTVKDVA